MINSQQLKRMRRGKSYCAREPAYLITGNGLSYSRHRQLARISSPQNNQEEMLLLLLIQLHQINVVATSAAVLIVAKSRGTRIRPTHYDLFAGLELAVWAHPSL